MNAVLPAKAGRSDDRRARTTSDALSGIVEETVE
jgi:hypothetical protein